MDKARIEEINNLVACCSSLSVVKAIRDLLTEREEMVAERERLRKALGEIIKIRTADLGHCLGCDISYGLCSECTARAALALQAEEHPNVKVDCLICGGSGETLGDDPFHLTKCPVCHDTGKAVAPND